MTYMEDGKTYNIYHNRYKDTTKKFYGIWNLLLVWRGSIFKLLWHDMVVFFFVYFLLTTFYRAVLVPMDDQTYKQFFDLVCVYAGKYSGAIPISFLTGFFVTQVVSRWWDQFMSMPWPDKVAMKLVCFVPGKDEKTKKLRRQVMRYINLSTVMVYRMVSLKVKKRFPHLEDLVEAKLLTEKELPQLKRVIDRTYHEITWAPILWAMKLLQTARSKGAIKVEAPVWANLISSFEYIEQCNRKLLNYGWINFPLAYTQVATVSVFLYFTAAIFGRQYLIPPEGDENALKYFESVGMISYAADGPYESHTPDFMFPWFTFIELLCYMGWIKVAECLLNPFGDDDEDFNTNYIIDRNLQICYLIVDEADNDLEIDDDPFVQSGETVPQDLPYKEPPTQEKRQLSANPSMISNITPSFVLEKFRSSKRSQISDLDGERGNKENGQIVEDNTLLGANNISNNDSNTTPNSLYVSVPEVTTDPPNPTVAVDTEVVKRANNISSSNNSNSREDAISKL